MEYMDLLPTTAPSLVYARETCTPYMFVILDGADQAWGKLCYNIFK